MIQAIVSPAKQMAVRADALPPRNIPPFPAQTERILRALRGIELERGPRGLQELWGVSDRLLAENLDRLHEFAHIDRADRLGDAAIARRVGPAALAYTGIQYRSMAPEVMDDRALEWLQGHLWIVSGLYGCARPFDAVQPYRLEMGAKLAVDGKRDLYAFWGGLIADALCRAATAGGAVGVVNLASVEYAKAVLPHLDPGMPVASCVFASSLRRGRPLQKSTESKTARGSMIRWMAERRVEELEDLMHFDVGFHFDQGLSNEEGPHRTLVFMKNEGA